jgi:hypothetical protein
MAFLSDAGFAIHLPPTSQRGAFDQSLNRFPLFVGLW